jgi:dolichyl-phosphate beta-glucosyltransferase
MKNDIEISLIFPAYNEAHRIVSTIKEAEEYFMSIGISAYEIIVSADGTDGTREKVLELSLSDDRIKAIGSPERLGKGHGIREAVKIASGKYIGFSDADNKTPITEFEKVYPYLKQGIEVVIGSRANRDSQIERRQPLYRQIGSKGFAIFMHSITGLWAINDTQCGFKFFQENIAHDLFNRQQVDGYMYDVEILYLAKQSGYRIQEVPIRWRDDGDSRLQLVSGNIQNVRDIFQICFGRMKKINNPIDPSDPAASTLKD